MKKNDFRAFVILGACAASLPVFANEQPTSNMNPAYESSRVQAHLRLNISEDADVVHFVRDTNDPKIITKTYILKHADPYSIRPYLREMVQAQSVSYNNPAGRENPYYNNVYSKENSGKTQRFFVPCGVECLKFADGTGVVIVSAEAYRFERKNGALGIDDLVAALDREGIMNSSGQPKYIYFPSNRSASELTRMIKLVGANVSNDTTELIGGKDKAETDTGLNCIFLNTALYSRKNIEDMLKIYDVPYPKVRMKCTVYEYDAENDGMIGLDFQAWKNNNGVKFLGTGAQMSRNYNIKDVLSPVAPDGTVNSHFFNFEPEWNTRFLDFLVSKGSARVVTSGLLSVRNGLSGKLERKGGMLYAALSTADKTAEHGNNVDVKPANGATCFTLDITPAVSEKAVFLKIKASGENIIGYESDGSLRKSVFSTDQTVTLGSGCSQFYIGGIESSRRVSASGGIPLLKDIPLLGWLFSTERESMKKTRIVVVGECVTVLPSIAPDSEILQTIERIKSESASIKNPLVAGRLGIDR